jgi:hypothetical protein
MSLGCVCAITHRIDAPAPRCWWWIRHPAHPGIPPATPLLVPNARQTSRLDLHVRYVGSGDNGNLHTRPATAQLLDTLYPYDKAAAPPRARGVQSVISLLSNALSDLSPHDPDGPSHLQKPDHRSLSFLQSTEDFPVFALCFCVESSDGDCRREGLPVVVLRVLRV